MDFTKKKITRLIFALNSKEREKVMLFLKSPYFVSPEYQHTLCRLFSAITKLFHTNKEIRLIDEEALFEQVFEGDTFVAGKIDKTFMVVI